MQISFQTDTGNSKIELSPEFASTVSELVGFTASAERSRCSEVLFSLAKSMDDGSIDQQVMEAAGHVIKGLDNATVTIS